MSFHEVRLDTNVERGAQGGPQFLTAVSTLFSGKEQRNALWEVARGEWDIGYGVQSRADADAVRDFFMARQGRLTGFRFKDWSDYSTGTVQQPTLEVADGSETVFALWRRYQDASGYYYEKRIWKPVAASVTMYVDGVENAGFTLDTTDGTVAFTTPPAYGADVTWIGEYDKPVRFDTDRLEIEVTTKEVLSHPRIPIVELKL